MIVFSLEWNPDWVNDPEFSSYEDYLLFGDEPTEEKWLKWKRRKMAEMEKSQELQQKPSSPYPE